MKCFANAVPPSAKWRELPPPFRRLSLSLYSAMAREPLVAKKGQGLAATKPVVHWLLPKPLAFGWQSVRAQRRAQRLQMPIGSMQKKRNPDPGLYGSIPEAGIPMECLVK